jgi:hypothetical protein
MDNRGLAVGVLRFIGYLALFGLMYGVLDLVALDLINQFGPAAQTTETQDMQSYIQSAWVYLPAIFIFFAAGRLLARAIFESKGGVR